MLKNIRIVSLLAGCKIEGIPTWRENCSCKQFQEHSIFSVPKTCSKVNLTVEKTGWEGNH